MRQDTVVLWVYATVLTRKVGGSNLNPSIFILLTHPTMLYLFICFFIQVGPLPEEGYNINWNILPKTSKISLILFISHLRNFISEEKLVDFHKPIHSHYFLYVKLYSEIKKKGWHFLIFEKKANVSFLIFHERWSVSWLHNSITCYGMV